MWSRNIRYSRKELKFMYSTAMPAIASVTASSIIVSRVPAPTSRMWTECSELAVTGGTQNGNEECNTLICKDRHRGCIYIEMFHYFRDAALPKDQYGAPAAVIELGANEDR